MSLDPRRMGRSHFAAMGTEIVVEAASQKALMDVADLFGEWEHLFTRFSPDSELSHVNDSPEHTVVVSEPFARGLRVALAAWKATGGLVDPTLATAVESAGYDRDFAELLLARESHPGQDIVSSGTGASQNSSAESEDDDGFTFGTPSVAPSTGTPQAQTHVS